MSKGPLITREHAVCAAQEFIAAHHGDFLRVALVGSVLRGIPMVHDVDLLVIPKPHWLYILDPPPPINVFVTTWECWQPALMHYAPDVGSVIHTRARAKAQGYKLNQYGLWRENGTLVSVIQSEIANYINTEPSRWVKRSLNGEGLLVLEG